MAIQIRDYLVYLAVRLIVCAIQAASMETCQRVAGALAWLAVDVLGVRRAVVDENLRHVFPGWTPLQRHQLARRMWQHLFIMMCEVAHVPRKVHETNWRNYLHIRDKEKFVRFLLDPRPVVLVSGHFGNFEMAAYTAGLLGFPTHAIARPLDNAFLHDFVNRFRSSKGQYMLPTHGSADRIQRLLGAGKKLALLGDQHAGTKGCWVDFLGRPASCHKALAVFTLTAGAPMIVAYARRKARPMQFEIGIQGLVDPEHLDEGLAGVKQLTQWYNRRLEELIRGTPSQYWWLHRRWKAQPPVRPRAGKSRPATPGQSGTRHVA